MAEEDHSAPQRHLRSLRGGATSLTDISSHPGQHAAMPEVPKRRKIHPLRDALLAGVVSFAISAIGLTIVYLKARDAEIQAVRTELLQLARATAAQIDGDPHQHLVSPPQQGSTLLFAARENPAQVPFVLADLKSRLSSSAVFAVRELNDEEQLEALELRARLRGFELPAETARYLQRRFPRDMRSLCEVLDTLDDAAFTAQRRITVPFIKEILDRKP